MHEAVCMFVRLCVCVRLCMCLRLCVYVYVYEAMYMCPRMSVHLDMHAEARAGHRLFPSVTFDLICLETEPLSEPGNCPPLLG